MLKACIRVEVDGRNEKIGYKIRQAQLEKIPYMLVVGDKEVDRRTVSVRRRGQGDIGEMGLEAFMTRICEEIQSRVCN